MRPNNFCYKATADIIENFIGIIFDIVYYFIVRILLIEVVYIYNFEPQISINGNTYTFPISVRTVNIIMLIYVCYRIMVNIKKFIKVLVRSHQELKIQSRQIVYSCGLVEKQEKTVQINKITSCLKHQNFIQKKCGSMDIMINTMEGNREIKFHNIGNGEEAYEKICSLAWRNEEHA